MQMLKLLLGFCHQLLLKHDHREYSIRSHLDLMALRIQPHKKIQGQKPKQKNHLA
jgi:hypothetical protein